MYLNVTFAQILLKSFAISATALLKSERATEGGLKVAHKEFQPLENHIFELVSVSFGTFTMVSVHHTVQKPFPS